RTTYWFEYVTKAQYDASGFDAAVSAPAEPAEGGSGTSTEPARQVVTGLDPTVGYRFRLLAANAHGTTTGDAGAVEPLDTGGRFFELATYGDGQGVGVFDARPVISDDGSRVSFLAGVFNEATSAPTV